MHNSLACGDKQNFDESEQRLALGRVMRLNQLFYFSPAAMPRIKKTEILEFMVSNLIISSAKYACRWSLWPSFKRIKSYSHKNEPDYGEAIAVRQ